MPRLELARQLRCGWRGGERISSERKYRKFSIRRRPIHHPVKCANLAERKETNKGVSEKGPLPSGSGPSYISENSSADGSLDCMTRRREEAARAAPPAWLFEAKEGGRLHLRERQRLFALASSVSPDVEDTGVAASHEQNKYIWGIPMEQHRPAAARRRQAECNRGILLRRQCVQAILEYGNEVERSWVYRHHMNRKEESGDNALEKVFRRAEMRGYLLFLVDHLPSLELRSLVASFLSTSLSEMRENQMCELLHLLQLGERQVKAKPEASSVQSAHSAIENAGLCGCTEGRCCRKKQRESGESEGSHSRGSCCESLTGDCLLQLLRCKGNLCVPPCLRQNTALRRLLLFIDNEHPLLRFVLPPGCRPWH